VSSGRRGSARRKIELVLSTGVLSLVSISLAAQDVQIQRVPVVTQDPDTVHAVWQSFEPAFRQRTCPLEGPAMGPRVECGYILVPEDRSNPESRLIRLAVLRVAAEWDSEQATVFLAGGPGGPAIEGLADGVPITGEDALALAEHGDVIFLDQRGTGYSEARFCDNVGRGLGGGPEQEADVRERLRRCLVDARARGIAVDAYSTWHNAHDVRDLRRALGHERWNLWGLSYGTRLAQAVVQIDRQGVRAVVLDSPTPAIIPTGLAHGFRSSLNAITDACARHARCREDIGDLGSRLVDAIASYAANPLPANGPGEALSLEFNEQILADGVFNLLYSASNYDDLPAVLRVLEARDAEAMTRYVESRAQDSGPSWGTGMALITVCRGASPTEETLRAERALEPVIDRWVFSAGFGRNGRSRCEQVYRLDPDASVRELESDVPTLVLSGLADPITPPSFADAVLRGLADPVHLEFPHTGHNVVAHLNRVSPGCGTALVGAYLSDPGAPLDVRCSDAIAPPPFLTSPRETKAPMQLLLGIQQGNPPVVLGVIVVGLVCSVIGFPLAALGRRIDGRRERAVRRARLLSWTGAMLSVAGGFVAGWVLATMIREHPVSLLVGVLPSIAWAGWLALAGACAAVLALVTYLRRGPRVGVGTTAGLCATATLCVSLLVFLFTAGAGPI
jgi:pimeloyl-ACP methyl ester carboxylesterase